MGILAADINYSSMVWILQSIDELFQGISEYYLDYLMFTWSKTIEKYPLSFKAAIHIICVYIIYFL